MALLEHQIDIDLGEGSIFELSAETKEALRPPEEWERRWEAALSGKVPLPLPVPEAEPFVRETTNVKAFEEVSVIVDAVRLLAKEPSNETMDQLKLMINKRKSMDQSA